MDQQYHNKIFIGLGFIISAFVCILVVFYFVGQTNNISQEKISRLESQLTDSIINEDKGQGVEINPVGEIKLRKIVETARDVYGANEINRRQGILWIDRGNSLPVITLGALNGLEAGQQLSVFDDTQKVGEAVVETLFDVVSYVRLVHKRIDDFDGDYYFVAVDEVSR